MQSRFVLLILYFVLSPYVLADTLLVNITGDVPRALKQNINAHLGTLPVNKSEQASFVFMAKKNTLNALKALGYYRATVTTSLAASESDNTNTAPDTLSINVVLNQPTLIGKVIVTVSGDAHEDEVFSDFLKKIPLVTGGTLHHGNYEELKESFISLGLGRGYIKSKFTKSTIAIKKDLTTADIILDFDSGQRYLFGKVKFSDFSLNSDMLKALTPFSEGDVYQQDLLQNFQNELDKTQYFSNVIVRPDNENTVNKTLDIDVSLVKAKRHQIDLGLGFATDTKENVSVGWKTPLINRFGHRQETKFAYSRINPTGHFIYGIPLTHPNDDVLQFRAALEENDFADITSKFFTYQLGRVYLDGEVLRQPYIRHLTEKWNLDGVDYNAHYYIPGITWSDKEWKGSALDPSHGFRRFYNIEGSYDKLNSETSFLRVNAQWKYVALLAPKHRFVSRLELGYIFAKGDEGKALSPSLRFYAGGDQSIRGFSYQSVGPEITLSESDNLGKKIITGGTNLIVGSAEYQYYFSNKWRGAIFTDGGSVNNTDKLDLVYSVGTGIHYISPVGAIRFSLGYPISEVDPSLRVHFSIGTEL